MPTQLERSSWVCGLCGSTVEELASPLHPPLDGPVIIRTHVLEAHGVTLADGGLNPNRGHSDVSRWAGMDARVRPENV